MRNFSGSKNQNLCIHGVSFEPNLNLIVSLTYLLINKILVFVYKILVSKLLIKHELLRYSKHLIVRYPQTSRAI